MTTAISFNADMAPACAQVGVWTQTGNARPQKQNTDDELALRAKLKPLGLEIPYSITSSARARTDGGIPIPSARAVLRFTAKLNSVGCSTGSLPGLAPLKILCT